MTAWWYWLLFLLAALLFAAIPIVNWLEDRADRHDRETWNRIGGSL